MNIYEFLLALSFWQWIGVLCLLYPVVSLTNALVQIIIALINRHIYNQARHEDHHLPCHARKVAA